MRKFPIYKRECGQECNLSICQNPNCREASLSIREFRIMPAFTAEQNFVQSDSVTGGGEQWQMVWSLQNLSVEAAKSQPFQGFWNTVISASQSGATNGIKGIGPHTVYNLALKMQIMESAQQLKAALIKRRHLPGNPSSRAWVWI